MREELTQILNIKELGYIPTIQQQGDTINIYAVFKKGAKLEYNGKYYNAYNKDQRNWRPLINYLLFL